MYLQVIVLNVDPTKMHSCCKPENKERPRITCQLHPGHLLNGHAETDQSDFFRVSKYLENLYIYVSYHTIIDLL
jgi:hypothetical protein